MFWPFVKAHVSRLDFKLAFLVCRKHRIDLNLLIDHNPELFVKHIVTFLRQVDEPDYINLIITSLRYDFFIFI